ncbi:MAG: hypothetical protein L3J59_07225 [Methylococcaceae bacterium]|nr:hypothetical protein [Methylococcaceae bacterium]
MIKKKKKTGKSKLSKTYDFSIPHEYYQSSFGLENERVNMYVLNISVGSMIQDFKIFEDLNNVQSWPISTLIQRELDHERASLICKDYLLKDGDTKYFPPLIAVLIPTDADYKPLDEFLPTSPEEAEQVNVKFVKGVEAYEEYEHVESISGGVSKIPFSENDGDLVWDRSSVTAVIIDGQHRYKALQEARNTDKKFDDCLVTVNLIDLSDICEKRRMSPTEVARDLFITINNTPVEIDETRVVLMDDKDVLATFTQVLIDDSADKMPAIRPELLDWECKGAKHTISNTLSGVLVLRQIILSAMFEDSKLSTLDDRINYRNVKRWKSKIEDWLAPDEIIKRELGNEETISHRFRLAEEEIIDNHDDDEEESIFLFSHSTAVSKLLKARFEDLLLPSFRDVFTQLFPYSTLIDLATKHGVLVNDTLLNNYYRAFKGKRAELFNDSEIKSAANIYEKEFVLITEDSIPHSVMGQKAIFKALFDGFLSDTSENTAEAYTEASQIFISNFNSAYEVLCPSLNADENFFLTSYKMKKNKVSKAKSVGNEFWKGIVIKYNGEIDYSKAAVAILSQVINDIIFYLQEDGSDKQFQFTAYNKLVLRHKRLINNLEFEDELSDEEMRELAEKIVLSKQKELTRLLP